MNPIPPAVQTLLKQKDFVGENRPAATLIIGGQPGEFSEELLSDPVNWSIWRNFTTSGKGCGNIAETNDGRCIVGYCQNGGVYLAWAPTVVGILSGEEVFDYEHAIKIFQNPHSNSNGYTGCSINMIDGVFHMIIGYIDPDAFGGYNTGGLYLDYWKDSDGNGNEMSFIANALSNFQCQNGTSPVPSYINKLEPSGDLVFGIGYGFNFGHEGLILYSSTSGLTWANRANPSGYYLGHQTSTRFMQFGDDDFITVLWNSNGSHLTNYFYNSGADVTTNSPDWSGWPTDSPSNCSWIELEGEIYMAWRAASWTTANLYKLNSDQLPVQHNADFFNFENWTEIVSLTCGQLQLGLDAGRTALIMQGSNDNYVSGAGVAVEPNIGLPILSINVDRSKGSASQLTAVIDNKNGWYAPDNILSEWFQVLWPNAVITSTMGYGINQQQVFKGLIDEITMNNYASGGATLEIVARDFSKRALDQMAQMYVEEPYPHIAYVLLYLWQTPEYIFNDLALKAGWAADKIHVEVTGMTLPEFKIPHEQYADAFQRLSELAAFEWLSDEATGDIYFRKAIEPEPVSVYVYREGEDIFKLGYKFSDAELYRDVVVWSLDENGNAVRATVTWSAADYNNVLPHKTLIIQAADIVTTVEGCAEIAQRQADAITPKPRSVDFVVIGNPYLQIGDCIQVIESSSTISELYRIIELTHQFDEGSNNIFTTSLKCYHYAYVPI